MRWARGSASAAVVMSGLLLAACGGDDDGAAATTTTAEPQPEDPASAAPAGPEISELTLSLTEIGEFDRPLAIVSRPEDTSLFVGEKAGRVYRLAVEGEGVDRTYTRDPEPVVDISDEVATGENPSDERGLLDIEFSPDGERLYLHYSQLPDGATRVVSYTYREPEDPGDGAEAAAVATVDEGSRREILALEQPFPNHNGGSIVFGPDGYLYVGLGDGGAGGDPEGNGQDPSTLLGSILRIDPESTVESEEPYAIPEDNPFADDSDGAPEVWLYGVRNPWRISFDAVTGDLWVGDVGQNEREEIDWLPAADGGGRGANLGWNEMEGSEAFDGGSNPSDAVVPAFDYPIPDEGCAVVGGYVYSGRAIPEMDAVYLFGDFCNPVLRALTMSNGEVTGDTELEGLQVESFASFGEDGEGELYLVSQSGPIYRLDP